MAGRSPGASGDQDPMAPLPSVLRPIIPFVISHESTAELSPKRGRTGHVMDAAPENGGAPQSASALEPLGKGETPGDPSGSDELLAGPRAALRHISAEINLFLSLSFFRGNESRERILGKICWENGRPGVSYVSELLLLPPNPFFL